MLLCNRPILVNETLRPPRSVIITSGLAPKIEFLKCFLVIRLTSIRPEIPLSNQWPGLSLLIELGRRSNCNVQQMAGAFLHQTGRWAAQNPPRSKTNHHEAGGRRDRRSVTFRFTRRPSVWVWRRLVVRRAEGSVSHHWMAVLSCRQPEAALQQ